MARTGALILGVFSFVVFALGGTAKPKQVLLTYHMPKAVAVSKAKSTTAKLDFSVEKGFHVQANPASEKFLIATELKLTPTPGFSIGKISYPPCKDGKAMGACKPHRIAGSDKAINAYEGTFQIGVPITADASVKPGAHKLSGTLKYQACNEQTCFFPTSLPVTLPVQVK